MVEAHGLQEKEKQEMERLNSVIKEFMDAKVCGS